MMRSSFTKALDNLYLAQMTFPTFFNLGENGPPR